MLHELSHHKSGITMRNTVIAKASSTINTSKNNKPTEKLQKSKVNEQPKLKCKDCEERFADKEALKAHRDVSHPLLCHVCLSCGQSFALAQALGRHTRNCQPKPSTSKDAQAQRGTKSDWRCDKCDFRLVLLFQISLFKRLIKHHFLRIHSAPYESELIFHRLHHTLGPMAKNQIIACPICTKEFRKHSLRCHLRQHTNEKIFACELCAMKFSRRHNLKDHMKIVHNVPAAVPKDPQLSSAGEETTKVKKRKVDGDKFACGICSKTFSSE